MSDKDNVQSGDASQDGAASTGDDTSQKTGDDTTKQAGDDTQSQAQPLTEERVQQLIAEATATAVAQAKDAGRRELQSEQDRNINTEKRAKFAESRVNAYETSFKGLDEDTQKDIELARYREQDKYFQTTAQEETQRQQDAAFYQRMNEGVLNYLDSLGIPRDDKRIDWGAGSQDYIEARSKLDASVAKIMTENKKVAEDKMKDDFKTLESSLRKDLNLDSDIPPSGGGSGSDSDADFKKGVGDGSIPVKGKAGKANYERARNLGIA